MNENCRSPRIYCHETDCIPTKCKCPRTKCPRHGDHAACGDFHSDPEKVLSFCKWAGITGFDAPDSKAAVRAWLSNDRTIWK